MKEVYKVIYVTLFTFIYKIVQVIVKEDENTVLFINEFSYTLNEIRDEYRKRGYNIINIDYSEHKMYFKFKEFCKAKYIYTDNYNLHMPYINTSKVKIQVWHAAIAIKRIGLKRKNIKKINKLARRMYLLVYDSYDFYVCPSKHMKDVYANSFKVSEDKLLELGYLKLDYYMSDEYKNSFLELKHRLSQKKNILYIPTFRTNDEDNKFQLEVVEKLINDFGDEYNVWYKLHREVKSIKTKYKSNLIKDGELEYVLGKCDILITDYSSVNVEALMHKTGIIYFTYDFKRYNDEVGLNVDFNDLIGTQVFEYGVLKELIDNKTYEVGTIEDCDSRYIPYNSGKKIVNKVIGRIHGM